MIEQSFIQKSIEKLSLQFKRLDDIALYNQEKVLNAFKKNRIALRHFYASTGYGYGDEGRDTLNTLFADIFNSESAICSPSIVSGTHALSLCLYGVLRPGDTILSVTGKPYDTLLDVIYGQDNGSLKDYGINFEFINLKNDKIDIDKTIECIDLYKPKMVYIQRSRGYEWRESLSVLDIKSLIDAIKNKGYNGCIMVDNCYGEFVDTIEPTDVGANLMAGSMIKNPGGGIALTGGYIAGDKKYVDMVQNRITAPSIGGEVGSYAYGYQQMYQGVFLAPHTVCQALKGSMLFGQVLTDLGYETSPEINKFPNDITRSIKFNDRNKLISFIQSIQANSPVDSHVEVLPWAMPGYEDEVIMAAGCFVQGSSIELSADAPVKPPYIAYLQGGLTFEHCVIALKNLDL